MPGRRRAIREENEGNVAPKQTRSAQNKDGCEKKKILKGQKDKAKNEKAFKDENTNDDDKKVKRSDLDGKSEKKDRKKLLSNENSEEIPAKVKRNDKSTKRCYVDKIIKGQILDKHDKNDVVDGNSGMVSIQKSELQPWPQRKEMEKKNMPKSRRNENCVKKESHDNGVRKRKLMQSKSSNVTKRSDDLEDFEPIKKPKLELKSDLDGKRKSGGKQDAILLNTLKEKKEKRKSANSVKKKEYISVKTRLPEHEEKISNKLKRKTGSKEQKGKRKESLKSEKKGKAKLEKEKKVIATGVSTESIEVMSEDSSNEEQETCKKREFPTKDSLMESQVISKPKVKVDMGDVTSVLLMMEGLTKNLTGDKVVPGPSGIQRKEELIEESSEEEESDWEEVAALPGHDSPKKSGPIEITLDAPEFNKKRKKKKFDIKAYFQRLANRFQKELRENIHKVHLMCLLCRGMYLNRLCGNELLRAQALSVLPHQFTSVSYHQYTPILLSKVLTWYQTKFPWMTNHDKQHLNLREGIEESFRTSTVISHLERALVLIILLRSLGLLTRLVTSLQPCPLKPTPAKALSRQNSKCSKKKITSTVKTSSQMSKSKESSGNEKRAISKSSKNKKSSNDDRTKSQYFKDQDKSLRRRGSKVKPKSYKDSAEGSDSEEEFIPSSEDDDDVNTEHSQGKRKGGKKNKKTAKKLKTKNDNTGSDEDFEEEQFTPRSPVSLVRKVIDRSKNRKILSDDSDVEEINGGDAWTEVFLEKEDQWYSISCLSGVVMKPHVIESQATKPVHYVYGFDNDGYIRDVTPRYASKWLTDTRKLRAHSDWLEETIEPYRCPNADLHLKENNAIQTKLVSQAMPTTVSELKNHPLYVLKRHLLKFEAIYPNSAIPVGYIKKTEPVYARECVHVLHSRENWLKEGRAVRVGEEPYKMVKSRPKWNRKKENPDALDLETFGHWQTEDYIPPPAYDGKVPRNGYGNIELFKPSMLPAGSVHLRLPGLNKVAKKLDIDCVPAMTGWDTHCGFSHPVLDGFVVCEEYKDLLIAAWDEDQEIQKQREIEKRDKRVIQNWTLLTKGLLIKERLKRKYLLQSNLQEEEKTGKSSQETSCGEKADDLSLAWPMNKEESSALSNAKHFKSETM